MMAKPRTTTRLRIGDKVEIEDGEDSGKYEVRIIRPEEDDCWLYATLPDGRDIEQQFPMTWIEDFFKSQSPDEWAKRKAKKPKGNGR
jgi:hypothetical protein